MTRAADRNAGRADRPFLPPWHMGEGPQRRMPGPLPLQDFLPRLQRFTRLIPVRVWRHGSWQVIWVVIRSVELVHVADTRARGGNNRAGRRQA
jgi:hypothetical protein